MRLEKIACRLFGRFFEKAKIPFFEKKLRQSRLFLPLFVYLSVTCLTAVAVSAAALTVAAVSVAFTDAAFTAFNALPQTPAPPTIPIMIAAATVFFGLTVWILAFLLPPLRAYDRRLKIEKQLPFAVNYMAAMAAAGIPAEKILRRTGEKEAAAVYGTLSEELALISMETDVFGKDAPSALHRLSGETSSPMLADFLRGTRNAMISGGDFSEYLAVKKYDYQNRAVQRKEKHFQTLDLLSEIYVTVFLAAPLFLMIMLLTMTPFSGIKTAQMIFLTYQAVPCLGIIFWLTAEILCGKEEV